MNFRKRFLPLLICFSLILTQIGTALAEGNAAALQMDESGTYLIGTAEELFAFAALAESIAAEDKAKDDNTRTALSAKLTADISLNPGASFAYDHGTGLVTVARNGQACKMGSGIKRTELGNFHPVYNGLCTWEEWNDTTISEAALAKYRNKLIEEMNEKVAALGLVKWKPIGTEGVPYIGYFDGNGYTIDGLYVNDNTIESAGIIGTAGSLFDLSGEYVSGEIKNLTIGQNSLVVGYSSDECGGTGAVVGRVNKYTVSDCTSRALIVGNGNGVAYNINSTAQTTNLYGLVGGIAGLTTGKVENCVNYGTVVSRESAGGIVGNLMDYDSNYSSVRSCTNYGSVYAEAEEIAGNAGGIAVNTGGRNYRNDYGGLIENCINRGRVEGGVAAGIVHTGAHSAMIRYCANRGEVFASAAASGLMDYIYSFTGSVSMYGCYNAGTVSMLPGSRAQNVYPIARRAFEYSAGGVGTHSVKNCYNDKSLCPAENDALCGAKIDAEKCYSVPTEVFATGEPTYQMGSSNLGGWRQNITAPNAETYPRLDGTDLVYCKTHYCCCTGYNSREKHKKPFYTNTGADITDPHTPNNSGICTHCGANTLKPVFTPGTLADAKVGEYYSATIRVSYNTGSIDGSKFAAANGLSGRADYSWNKGYFFEISGIPTEAGELTFTLSASNDNGTTDATYTLTIKDNPLEITTRERLDNATAQESYSEQLYVNWSLPTTWALANGSSLPEGLTLGEDGKLGGTPSANGTYTFTVAASANGSTAEKTFTLVVLEAGGCRHGKKTWLGIQATCRNDGVEDYFHCNICDCDFDANGDRIWGTDNLKSASNHSDNDGDGKCDSCKKNMPIFKRVTNESDIVYGGTYIFVMQIGEKYYALTIPPEGKSGREYTEFMNLCEITKKPDGSFDFNHLEENNAIMLKTEFASEGGSLDAGTPRYGLSSVFGGKRYGLYDSGPYFGMYPNKPAKYGYRIALNGDGAAEIASVYQKWWSTAESEKDGLLRAFDMTLDGESTKLMSFGTQSEISGNYPSADLAEYPIYLYRMTEVGNRGSVTFTVNDTNSSYNSGGFTYTEDAGLSGVSGISNAVEQTVVETAVATAIDAAASAPESVSAQITAQISVTASQTENDGKEDVVTSVKYSVTPKIVVTDGSGNILSESAIPDSGLSGAPMTVALYTGGIYEPEQLIHYKEDGTKEYFYSELYYGAPSGAKTFEYDNGFAIFTITDFSEIEILKTAVSEDGAENALSFDGKTLTASVDADGTCTVVFAGYEKDGSLSLMQTAVSALKKGANTIAIPENVDASAIDKIFLWKDIFSMQPLCAAWEKSAK